MKRVFGMFEIIFDILYLVTAFILGLYMVVKGDSQLSIMAGIMAIVLSAGDSFHLIPRIMVIKTCQEDKWRKSLGIGKQITSISMTIFYLILWEIGVAAYQIESSILTYIIYGLAIIRIGICIMPGNKWTDRYPPVSYGIARNTPFFLMGIIISISLFVFKLDGHALSYSWLAILLSFAFYLPVVIWANKNPKIGMLMFPKTCAYLWLIIMCLGL